MCFGGLVFSPLTTFDTVRGFDRWERAIHPYPQSYPQYILLPFFLDALDCQCIQFLSIYHLIGRRINCVSSNLSINPPFWFHLISSIHSFHHIWIRYAAACESKLEGLGRTYNKINQQIVFMSGLLPHHVNIGYETNVVQPCTEDRWPPLVCAIYYLY